MRREKKSFDFIIQYRQRPQKNVDFVDVQGEPGNTSDSCDLITVFSAPNVI